MMFETTTPASTTQLPATDATIPQQQQPAIRTVSTCSSSFSSTSVCKDTEILTMKSTVSHLKNENYELTENIHRQNMAFISWQSSVDEELAYLQKEVLSSRQNKKYQAWKQERRKRNTLELEAKVEKIEKSIDIGMSMGDVSCGLLQNSGKIDLDKSNISGCSVDENGSSVSLDKIHNDRQMLLDLRVQRDQLLTDKEALAIQYSNSQQYSNSEHEQITALQNQVEELRQTAMYLMDEMQQHEYEKLNLNGGRLEVETESQETIEETTLQSLDSIVLADVDDLVTNIE